MDKSFNFMQLSMFQMHLHLHKLKQIYLIIALSLTTIFVHAQKYGQYDTIQVPAFVVDGDTIPGNFFPTVTVYGKMRKDVAEAYKEWTRLRNAVYLTYPYAKNAGRVFNDINAHLAGVTEKSERSKYIKSREKELKKEFSDKLTKLSIYQGKVLMKLIYRETNNSCYEIIKEMKGGFSATFWQTVAIIFGSNLKQTYDAKGEDAKIESIVLDVIKMYGY
jgi:hypothetical protein